MIWSAEKRWKYIKKKKKKSIPAQNSVGCILVNTWKKINFWERPRLWSEQNWSGCHFQGKNYLNLLFNFPWIISSININANCSNFQFFKAFCNFLFRSFQGEEKAKQILQNKSHLGFFIGPHNLHVVVNFLCEMVKHKWHVILQLKPSSSEKKNRDFSSQNQNMQNKYYHLLKTTHFSIGLQKKKKKNSTQKPQQQKPHRQGADFLLEMEFWHNGRNCQKHPKSTQQRKKGCEKSLTALSDLACVWEEDKNIKVDEGNLSTCSHKLELCEDLIYHWLTWPRSLSEVCRT